MPSNRVPRRLQDIIDNAQAIFRYTDGMDLAAFEKNPLVYDAVERWLERISEASARLGDMASHLSRISHGRGSGLSATSCATNTTKLGKTGFSRLLKPISPSSVRRPKKRCAAGLYPKNPES